MSNETKKSGPWLKVLKLFFEFLVAAVTAFLTSTSGSAMGIW